MKFCASHITLFIVFLAVNVCSQTVKSEDAKPADTYIICKNLKLVRTLRIQDAPDKKGCEVIYTKDGISKVQGAGQYTEGCKKILGNIKANLEKGWWKCKDVTNTIQIAD